MVATEEWQVWDGQLPTSNTQSEPEQTSEQTNDHDMNDDMDYGMGMSMEQQ